MVDDSFTMIVVCVLQTGAQLENMKLMTAVSVFINPHCVSFLYLMKTH